MSWDVEAKKLAIKVIGTVETNMKYDAINYRDPITVGIMQWYGTRAANLLNLMRATPAWVGVAASLNDDLASQSETNGTFWTNRRVTKSEGQSLQPVLRSSIGKQIQHEKTLADLEDYSYAAAKVYIDVDTNTDAFIYFCVMYHQGPSFAREIARQAGANPTLERLHSLCRNHHWFRDYAIRYNTARAMILSHDTSGIPDFGAGMDPSDPDPDDNEEGNPDAPGTPPPTIEQTKGNILSVRLVGNAIHVKTTSGNIICQPTNTGREWLPGATKDQPGAGPVVVPPTPNPDPTTPPTGDNAATKAAVVAFLVAHKEKFGYSQGAGRDVPLQSGVADCSSIVAWAYDQVAGINIKGNTQSQYQKGAGIWSNLPGNGVRTAGTGKPPDAVMQAGDLVFFARDTSWSRPRHVEMYMGDGRFIGWGGPTPTYSGKGPYIKPNAQSYMSYYKWITVRRLL